MIWIILRDVGFVFTALIYAITVAMGALYYLRYRQAAQEGMAGRRKCPGRRRDFGWVGALPAHVWLGAVALFLTLTVFMAFLGLHYTQPGHWWGVPLIDAALLCWLLSLWKVAAYELRLIR